MVCTAIALPLLQIDELGTSLMTSQRLLNYVDRLIAKIMAIRRVLMIISVKKFYPIIYIEYCFNL
jgi:hypothetical protein